MKNYLTPIKNTVQILKDKTYPHLKEKLATYNKFSFIKKPYMYVAQKAPALYQHIKQDKRLRQHVLTGSICLLGIIGATWFAGFQYYKTTADYAVKQINLKLQDAIADTTYTRNIKISEVLKMLSDATKRFPDRLDIRIGKTFLCNSLNQIPCMERGILNIIERSHKNNAQWLWKDGETKDKAFMLNEIQNYQKRFYELGYDNEAKRVAEAVLKYYPDHYESLNTLGTLYALQKQNEKALEYFQRAQALAPHDTLIKDNIQELERRMARQEEVKKQARQKKKELVAKQAQKSTKASAKTQHKSHLKKGAPSAKKAIKRATKRGTRRPPKRATKRK